MIGIDTNILLRWLIDESFWPSDQPNQTAAAGVLLNDPSQQFFVNSVVVSETLWVLEKPMKQPKSALLEVLDKLLKASNFVVENYEATVAARRSFAAQRSGMHDRLIAETNKMAGCAYTATFDIEASKTPGFKLLGTQDRRVVDRSP